VIAKVGAGPQRRRAGDGVGRSPGLAAQRYRNRRKSRRSRPPLGIRAAADIAGAHEHETVDASPLDAPEAAIRAGERGRAREQQTGQSAPDPNRSRMKAGPSVSR
jgi:hypothetical protein